MFSTQLKANSLLILCIYGLLFSSRGFGAEPVLENNSSSGLGYLFVRLVGANDQLVVEFEFTNQDNGFVVKVDSTECESGGSNSRICMVLASPGRYFWSKHEAEYRMRLERSQVQDPAIIRDAPGSASDTFEVVAGAINYIGDWELSISSGNIEQRSLSAGRSGVTQVRRWSIDTRQNNDTLQKLFEIYPDRVNRYDIYLSMMGKQAISLQEFLKLVEQNAE
jgi:hypothetical protein